MKAVFGEVILIGLIEVELNLNEKKLLNEAKCGNVKAFESLMSQYIKILYNYILSKISNMEDVNDVLQESMLAIWQGLKGFKEDSSFKTWTIGITRRKIADFYRKYYNQNHFETTCFLEIENHISTRDEISNAIDKADIDKSISILSERDKELLFLIFNAQLTYGEIEEITGISKGTIKSRVYTLKKKLRPLLSEGGSINE